MVEIVTKLPSFWRLRLLGFFFLLLLFVFCGCGIEAYSPSSGGGFRGGTKIRGLQPPPHERNLQLQQEQVPIIITTTNGKGDNDEEVVVVAAVKEDDKNNNDKNKNNNDKNEDDDEAQYDDDDQEYQEPEAAEDGVQEGEEDGVQDGVQEGVEDSTEVQEDEYNHDDYYPIESAEDEMTTYEPTSASMTTIQPATTTTTTTDNSNENTYTVALAPFNISITAGDGLGDQQIEEDPGIEEYLQAELKKNFSTLLDISLEFSSGTTATVAGEATRRILLQTPNLLLSYTAGSATFAYSAAADNNYNGSSSTVMPYDAAQVLAAQTTILQNEEAVAAVIADNLGIPTLSPLPPGNVTVTVQPIIMPSSAQDDTTTSTSNDNSDNNDGRPDTEVIIIIVAVVAVAISLTVVIFVALQSPESTPIHHPPHHPYAKYQTTASQQGNLSRCDDDDDDNLHPPGLIGPSTTKNMSNITLSPELLAAAAAASAKTSDSGGLGVSGGISLNATFETHNEDDDDDDHVSLNTQDQVYEQFAVTIEEHSFGSAWNNNNNNNNNDNKSSHYDDGQPRPAVQFQASVMRGTLMENNHHPAQQQQLQVSP